jgi:hypothetical protein
MAVSFIDRSVVFSGTPVSSTNKTDCHDIADILLKVVLNTINQTNCTFSKRQKKSLPHLARRIWISINEKALQSL